MQIRTVEIGVPGGEHEGEVVECQSEAPVFRTAVMVKRPLRGVEAVEIEGQLRRSVAARKEVIPARKRHRRVRRRHRRFRRRRTGTGQQSEESVHPPRIPAADAPPERTRFGILPVVGQPVEDQRLLLREIVRVTVKRLEGRRLSGIQPLFREKAAEPARGTGQRGGIKHLPPFTLLHRLERPAQMFESVERVMVSFAVAAVRIKSVADKEPEFLLCQRFRLAVPPAPAPRETVRCRGRRESC